MIITATGHRPNKLGGYNATENFKLIRHHMKDFLISRSEDNITVISGGALGIDQFWMEVGLYLNLPVTAALPFKGYDSRWPVASRQEYEKLLARCQNVLYISEPGYAANKLQIRNEWMVDHCDELAAYYDGWSKGGTRNCIDYAVKKNKIIHAFNIKEIIS